MLTDPSSHRPAPKPRKQWPWYRPVLRNWRRYYLRQFPRKKKLHGGLLHRILGNRLFDPGLWLPTRDTVAWGMALGTFIGLLPFPGLQIFLSMLLCFAFRVNVTAAVVATFLSNPLTVGPLLYVQTLVGSMLVGSVDPAELEGYTGFARKWVEYGKPLMFGAVVTGAGAAILSYVLTLLLWSGFSKAAVKAIAVSQAKKAAHLHADQQGGPEPADQALHAGHGGPADRDPGPGGSPDPVPGGPEGGLGLAGEPFPEAPGPASGSGKS
jgi:uncharacterized protein